jgi:Leucine-rich repeat (LRR) protein
LDAVADTLEELWLSYNLIEKLNGVEVCKKLKNLYLSNNKIKTWVSLTVTVRMLFNPLLIILIVEFFALFRGFTSSIQSPRRKGNC